jgi:pectate lyase
VLDLSQRQGARLLDAGEVSRQFGSRAAIFAAFDGGTGWDPQP